MTDHDRSPGAGAGHRRRERSPSYPGISLQVAVGRAKQLYEAERRHAAPVEAVTKAWGYTNSGSGSATVTLAALKKFGLLDEERSEGERILRLSDLALDILLNPEPEAALRQAALMPAIHKEMWEKYRANLPSADTLRWQLVKRGFTESGAQDFLKVYRDTIAFAQLDASGKSSHDDDPDHASGIDQVDIVGNSGLDPHQSAPGGERSATEPPATHQPIPAKTDINVGRQTPSSGLRIPIPLVGGSEVVYIEGQFPLTEQAWTQFISMVAAMKPGLVKPEE